MICTWASGATVELRELDTEFKLVVMSRDGALGIQVDRLCFQVIKIKAEADQRMGANRHNAAARLVEKIS
jgi:hypothetical protein